MHNDLTSRQQDVLNALKKYMKENDVEAPSYRELGQELNWKSSSTVCGYLNKLKEAGYVTWREGRPRTLKVVKKKAQLV
ncbi:transcriptional regulator [Bacillus weihaiensis]|uniref:LexA family protein n=1 Tax=Bacillus weihaiensis TaxID=1547283 RepID=UPI0023567B0C|nr:transcriptional regulator [Bacillus weihaiensis]